MEKLYKIPYEYKGEPYWFVLYADNELDAKHSFYSYLMQDENKIVGQPQKTDLSFVKGTDTYAEGSKVWKIKRNKSDKINESMKNNKPLILEKRKLSKLQAAYKDFFFDMLDVYDVSSPAELDEKDKKEFFSSIKSKWPYRRNKVNKSLNESIDKDLTLIQKKQIALDTIKLVKGLNKLIKEELNRYKK